jgi:acetoin utilization deacetylase AcuC-like enzyme
MIFYNPDCDLNFENFGIEIPIADDRAKRVFIELKKLNSNLNIFPLTQLLPITIQDLHRAHTQDYIDKLFSTEESLKNAMETCYELIDTDGNYNRYNPDNAKLAFSEARTIILNQVAMLYASTREALNSKFSFFLGGGMHHAMSFGGRGFCLVNDIVIVIRRLQEEKLLNNVWVIDLDAHKGDGTAELTKNDSTINTLSIHMKNGWPLNSGVATDPWFIPSDMDIEIDSGEEETYLTTLATGLSLFEKKFKKPDLVIIVDGADPYTLDQLPSSAPLKLSKAEMLQRDILVYNFFNLRNIPMSYCMAGGYGRDSWEIYFQFLFFVGQSSSEGSKVSFR